MTGTELDEYVSKVNWLVARGRDDLIDEIADECERRIASARHGELRHPDAA